MATNKKELDIRYLAGFVDGEGCIGITRTKNGLAGNNYRYFPYLAINNTNYEILQRIKTMYPKGRKIAEVRNHTGKPIFSLRIDGNELVNILQDLIPHLIEKKKQAELVLDFKKSLRKKEETKKRITPEENELRYKYYISAKMLKKNPTEANLPILEAGRMIGK